MPNGWTKTAIGDVADVVGGGTPSTRDAGHFGGDIPWLTPKDLAGYSERYIAGGERTISQKGLASSAARLLPPRSVLVSSRAPVGYVAIASRPVTTNQGFRSLVLRDGHVPEFFYYLLKANRAVLEANATGTTFGELSGSRLKQLEFDVPPPSEQRAIAGVLGALDDKIELNRRMNETLVALAETTHSKLRQSSHQSRRVGDVLELAYGRALKESNRQPGPVLVYGSNGVVGRHDEALSPGPGIIVGRKGNPGVVTWVDEPFYAIDTTFYVVPRLSEASLYHLYFALRKLDLPSFAADSAVPGLNRNIAYGLEIELPEPEVLQRFDSVVSDLFAKRAANERESRTLAELRDALLPKLISGELRVRAVEEAGQASSQP